MIKQARGPEPSQWSDSAMYRQLHQTLYINSAKLNSDPSAKYGLYRTAFGISSGDHKLEPS